MEQLLESLKSKGWPSFESRMQLAFSLFTGSLAVHHIASRFSRLQRIAGASENQRLEAIKLFAATSDKSNDGASIRDYWKTRDGEHDWLENVDSAEALEWVKENNAAAFNALGNPKESPSYGTILSILENKDKIPHISLIGDLYYNYWTDDVNVRGILRRTSLLSYKSSTPKWEIVLDIDKLCNIENESWVYKGYTIYKPDDKNIPVTRCLMKLSRGGADATVVREFDLITKSFVLPTSTNGCDGNSSKSNSNLQQCGFVIPEAKSFVSWKDENTLLIVNQPWVALPDSPFGQPKIKAKGGESIWLNSSLVFLFGNQKNAGTTTISAVKNKRKVKFASRTKISVMKNHINGLGYADGKIIVTPHGFLAGKESSEEKKSIEKYKGEQSEYWKEVIGVEGDFKLEEEKQEV